MGKDLETKKKRKKTEKAVKVTSSMVHVPKNGTSVEFDNGITIHVYPSIEKGRMVIEIETRMKPQHSPRHVQHDKDGRPQIKVMVNEAIISNDGGEEPVSVDIRDTDDTNNVDSNYNPHVFLHGTLAHGFTAFGPYPSPEAAQEAHAIHIGGLLRLRPPYQTTKGR